MHAKTALKISLTRSEQELLLILAKRDHVPVATKATQLIRLAMNDEEDRTLVRLAEMRDTPGATWMSHEEFWQAVKAQKKMQL